VPRKNSLIAVIDDDQSMARMLSRVIRAEGLGVEWFRSAEEFLNSGSLCDFDCLVLDMNLPGMSGIDLQRRLNDSGVEIPIVFISGQAEEATRQYALAAGAAGFFSKPFSIDSLLANIRSLVPANA
jgi:FixJ family two-component response regulator